MPTFEKTIFTNQGISFINDLNSAHSRLVSANTVYSSSDLSGMNDDDIKNMTDISNKELTVSCDILKLDGHQTKIRSTANNEQLKQGIYIRTYATYVVDQDGNQTLFAIKVNTKPQYLAAYDGVNTNAQSYGFNVGISQTDSINFTKLSNLAATVQDLSDLKQYANGYFDKSLLFRGYWTDNLMNLTYQQTGIYGISNNFKNAPKDFSGYGVANVYKNDTDSWIDLIDNTNGRWTCHIGSDWQKNMNDIDMAAMDSKAQSYASSAARNVSATLSSSISSNFQFRGYWNDNLMNLTYQPTGTYGISNNFKEAPKDFSGYGVANVFRNDTDSWIDLIDNTNGRWTVHIGSEWQKNMNNIDMEAMDNRAQSYANSAASSASTNLSSEIDNGYQFRGYYSGSFNDLRNKKRGTYALAQYSDGMPNGFSGYGNLVVSGNDTDTYFTLNDNLGGMWTKVNSDMWHAVSVNDDTNSIFKNRGYWNDNIMNLTYQPAGTYGISNNFKNAPEGFSGYGVANVYKNDTDSWVDLIDNTNGRWTVHIGSEWQKVINKIDLDKALGNEVTDNHDGTITFNGYTQAMFKTVTAAVDYNDLASPGRFILPNNVSGTYVNSPLQLVGVEGTVIVDVINNNNGDIYQTAYVPSVNTTLYRQFSFQKWTDWIQLATNQQITNLQTQINTIDASVLYKGTIDGSTDLNKLITPGIYMCSYTVPLNSPSQFKGNFPRFKIQVSSVANGIVNQTIYMFDGLGADSMPSYFNRNSTSPGVWNAWQHTDTI